MKKNISLFGLEKPSPQGKVSPAGGMATPWWIEWV
jgi:hypothetical protein